MGNKRAGSGTTHDFGQIEHISHQLAQPFAYDEPSGQRLLGLLFHHPREDSLEICQVIMFIPPHAAPRDLYALSDRIIDRTIRHNDVATLTERGYNAGDRAERLSVDDACCCPQEGSDVLLDLHMYILSAVEAWWTTGSNAVGAQGLNSSFFELFVRDEVIVVVRGEVRHGAAV